jgi:hypothetical protein
MNVWAFCIACSSLYENRTYYVSTVITYSGEADEKCIHESIPFWHLLRVRQAEGAGES